MKVEEIDIKQIDQFSNRDRDYYLNDAAFKSYIEYPFSYDQFDLIVEAKKRQTVDRALLVSVLEEQYNSTQPSEKVRANIKSLISPDTFTIVTAHQPSLMTGPLYYIFKILSAINLADQLDKEQKQYNVVPVFIIGAEDHDFEEVNHMHLYGKKITWENKGIGPIGQFSLDGIKEVLDEISESLGDNSKAKDMIAELRKELPNLSTYGEFSFHLTQKLFDHLGLVVLRMGDKRLKEAFSPIIKKEIVERPSQALVVTAQESIEKELGYSGQAHAREINFFYVDNQGRNRIEYLDGKYIINGTDSSFSEKEILDEIDNHPDKFSPNVVMRPLFQEFILPNLAYIGGGGELAYWIERKSQFEHFGIPYPMLIRRQSGMIFTSSHQKNIDKLGLNIGQLFQTENILVDLLLAQSDHSDYKLSKYKEQINEIFDVLTEEVQSVEVTLARSASAEKTKALKSIDYLESKVKKAIKQKEDVTLNRMRKLKTTLFPKGLQERHDNIFQYISSYGLELIDQLLPHCNPFDKSFKIFKPK